MTHTSKEKRAALFAAFADGKSVRVTAKKVGVDKNTSLKYHKEFVRKLAGALADPKSVMKDLVQVAAKIKVMEAKYAAAIRATKTLPHQIAMARTKATALAKIAAFSGENTGT